MKKQLALGFSLAIACGLASVARGAVILNDTFATSTLNAAAPAAPTATATNYQVLSTKNATASSIVPGSLQLNMDNTSSGFAELQALVAPSPITLTQTGDYVEAKVCFTPTGVNLSGNSTLNIGLYNSGGAGPVPGTQLNNGQLDDSGVFATGNAAGWTGYVGRMGLPGGASSQIFTRPAQVGETTAEAQDALFTNAGGGAFDNPSGNTIQGGGAGALLVNGTEYTLLFRAAYDASAGTVDLSYTLSDANGVIDSLAGTASGGDVLATAFDALAVGYRATDSNGPYSLDISCVEINAQVVPEPAALVLMSVIGLSGLALSRRR